MNIILRIARKIKKDYVMFMVNKVYVGTRPKTFPKKRRLLESIGYSIGDNTCIVGPIYLTTNIKIGKNCWIGADFRTYGNGTVIIEDNCDIAPMVEISTGSHKIGDSNRRAGIGINEDVLIGRGSWIGTRVTIINGVNIGSGNVIAAGSVVTKNTENDVLVAGVPAKNKKKLG